MASETVVSGSRRTSAYKDFSVPENHQVQRPLTEYKSSSSHRTAGIHFTIAPQNLATCFTCKDINLRIDEFSLPAIIFTIPLLLEVINVSIGKHARSSTESGKP